MGFHLLRESPADICPRAPAGAETNPHRSETGARGCGRGSGRAPSRCLTQTQTGGLRGRGHLSEHSGDGNRKQGGIFEDAAAEVLVMGVQRPTGRSLARWRGRQRILEGEPTCVRRTNKMVLGSTQA